MKNSLMYKMSYYRCALPWNRETELTPVVSPSCTVDIPPKTVSEASVSLQTPWL